MIHFSYKDGCGVCGCCMCINVKEELAWATEKRTWVISNIALVIPLRN